MSLQGLECQVFKSVNGDTCLRSATQGAQDQIEAAEVEAASEEAAIAEVGERLTQQKQELAWRSQLKSDGELVEPRAILSFWQKLTAMAAV
jgi:hypothetical protein